MPAADGAHAAVMSPVGTLRQLPQRLGYAGLVLLFDLAGAAPGQARDHPDERIAVRFFDDTPRSILRHPTPTALQTYTGCDVRVDAATGQSSGTCWKAAGWKHGVRCHRARPPARAVLLFWASS